MDLLGCPRCNERFVLADAGGGGWVCRACERELRVLAHAIPPGIVSPEDSSPGRLHRVVRTVSSPPFRSL